MSYKSGFVSIVGRPNVVYDHAYSSFSQSDVEDYKWEDILELGDIFYFSGVTPAASDSVCQSLKRALKVL